MHNIEVVHYFYNMPLRNVLVLHMRKLRGGKKLVSARVLAALSIFLIFRSKSKNVVSANTIIISSFKIILVFISHLQMPFWTMCLLDKNVGLQKLTVCSSSSIYRKINIWQKDTVTTYGNHEISNVNDDQKHWYLQNVYRKEENPAYTWRIFL